jgi:uncharacterized protein (DUF697 family)
MTAAATATIDMIEPGVRPDPEKNAQALEIVNKWSLWSMAPGVLPFPFLDLVAIAGIQMNMLKDLSHVYGLKFSSNRVKNVVGSLLGSFGMAVAGTGVAFSVIKAVPIVGKAAGILALPAVAGASTYALGRVFATHFASGGTFLSFDPDKVREHFQRIYQENLHDNLKKAQDKKDAGK